MSALSSPTHSFEDSNVHILDREDRWFERGDKEAIYVKESFNRGGVFRYHLPHKAVSQLFTPLIPSALLPES